MLNRVILIGRLAQDPEMRYTPNGVAVCRFTLAVNRPFANQAGERVADFLDVVVWRKLAENCANYLSKGRLVAVEGRIQVRTYETQEGQKRKVVETVADTVKFLEKPPGGARENPSAQNEGWEALGKEVDVKGVDMVEDDIPF